MGRLLLMLNGDMFVTAIISEVTLFTHLISLYVGKIWKNL